MNRFWWVWPSLVLGFGVIASGVIAGRSGALVAFTVSAAIPLVVCVSSLGARHRRRGPPRRADPKDGWRSFHHIASELGWARVSRRHFDTAPRRMLQRVAAAVLDSRAGVDFYAERDRERAAQLIGPDLWPLLDPRRAASTDTGAAGIAPQTIDRLLTRLEQL